MPDTPPLWVDGLTRSYGRLVGLDKLDLTLKAGECVALIGANGSGKSTAIRTMAGLLEPSGGSVRICGHDPHSEPDAEEARAALALVPDTPLLYDDLTVRQHLGLVALAHGVLDDDTPARIDALIDQLGLTERADFLPTELSRGLRQKTGLACALIRPSRVLMLDEPVVGLDPPSQALLRQLLLDAKAEGKAILLTTHQMRFADGIADRAIVLGDGKVLDRGPMEGRARARRRQGLAARRCLTPSPSRARVSDVRRFWRTVLEPPGLLRRLEPAYYVLITLVIAGPFIYGTAREALAEVATPRALETWGPSIALVGLLALVRWGAVQGPVVFSVADVAQLLGAPLRRAELVLGRLVRGMLAAAGGGGRRRARSSSSGSRGTIAASQAAAPPISSSPPRSSACWGSRARRSCRARRAGTVRPGWRAGRSWPPRSAS